jgi:hypothetical protein
MNDNRKLSRVLRSIWAVFAGFLVGAVLSLGTDVVLHAVHVYPPWDQPIGAGLSALALSYRIPYTIISGYVMARLAPDRPMRLAVIGGIIGFALSLAGAVATWNKGLGPHWYPVALGFAAIPCTLLGAQWQCAKTRNSIR